MSAEPGTIGRQVLAAYFAVQDGGGALDSLISTLRAACYFDSAAINTASPLIAQESPRAFGGNVPLRRPKHDHSLAERDVNVHQSEENGGGPHVIQPPPRARMRGQKWTIGASSFSPDTDPKSTGPASTVLSDPASLLSGESRARPVVVDARPGQATPQRGRLRARDTSNSEGSESQQGPGRFAEPSSSSQVSAYMRYQPSQASTGSQGGSGSPLVGTPARARGVPTPSATLPRVAALIGASPKPAPPPSATSRLGGVSNRRRITLALESVCLAGSHSSRELLAALEAMRDARAAEQFLVLLASPESHAYRGLYAVVPSDGPDSPQLRLLRVHGHGPDDITGVLADSEPQPQRGLRITGTFKYATSQRGFASLSSVHPGLTTDAITIKLR